MRYAHMVRAHQPPLPVPSSSNTPRKFRPITKRANTLALDARHAFLSNRAPIIALLLLSLPFFTALVRLLSRSSSPEPVYSKPNIHNIAHNVPLSGAYHPAPIIRATPVPIDISSYLSKLDSRRKTSKLTGKSITLIAACKNRQESLSMAFPSWTSQAHIDQIVLIEWSHSQYEWHRIPHLAVSLQSGRLTIVHVDGGDWALSRAYNLAAQFAIGEFIVKVDCDTYLRDDFFDKHPLPPKSTYYFVPWGTPRNSNEERLRGVWFARRADFFKVGGYDERIVRYGYEDTDLYNRFDARASLSFKSFDLDTLRHNVAPDLVYQHTDDFIISRRISVRTNEAMVKGLTSWVDVNQKYGNQYSFSYDNTSHMVIANITRSAPDLYAEMTEEHRGQLLAEVLQTSLHDDFNLPWDLLPSLSLDDLTFLARYLDTISEPRVIVALLEGLDTLSNMFNLISALQLAVTHAKPVIIIWDAGNGTTVSDIKTPLFNEIFDVSATNEQLVNIAKTDAMKKFMTSGGDPENVRIIAADRWRCVEGIVRCGEKYDKAYSSFTEVGNRMAHVFDEVEPLPLTVARHTFVRLRDRTKIGNRETRTLMYKSLVQSAGVREAQQRFVSPVKYGVVADSLVGVNALSSLLKKEYNDWVQQGTKELMPIVGEGHIALRKQLFDSNGVDKFCVGITCTVDQMRTEVANVLGMCEASELVPHKNIRDERGVWLERFDYVYMMVHDLWSLHHG